MAHRAHLPHDVRRFFSVRGAPVLLHGGLMAKTHRSGGLVVQYVTKQSLEHHRAVLTLTNFVKKGALPGVELFCGGQLQRPDRSFWRAAKHLDGQLLSVLDGADAYYETALGAVPGVCAQLQALADAGATGACMPSSWTKANISCERIGERFAAGGQLARNLLACARGGPVDIDSPVVLGHGDPVPKNTIVDGADVTLIDFELAGMMPAHFDVGHCAAHYAFRLDGARALELTKAMLSGRSLPCGRDETIGVAVWGLLRDPAVWLRDKELAAASNRWLADSTAAVQRLLAVG